MASKRAPKSPWQKYNKNETKIVYSPQYHAWKQAAKSFGAGDPRTIVFACQHARMVRMKNEACKGIEI